MAETTKPTGTTKIETTTPEPAREDVRQCKFCLFHNLDAWRNAECLVDAQYDRSRLELSDYLHPCGRWTPNVPIGRWIEAERKAAQDRADSLDIELIRTGVTAMTWTAAVPEEGDADGES